MCAVIRNLVFQQQAILASVDMISSTEQRVEIVGETHDEA